MEKSIKMSSTNEGKMLSGFVNKYLIERHTFNTKVCSYSFGLGLDDATEPNNKHQPMSMTVGTNGVKFPKSQ